MRSRAVAMFGYVPRATSMAENDVKGAARGGAGREVAQIMSRRPRIPNAGSVSPDYRAVLVWSQIAVSLLGRSRRLPERARSAAPADVENLRILVVRRRAGG